MKKTLTLPVQGMDCASCANIISRSVAKMPGISQSDVNIATEKATITYETDKISLDKIADKVKDLGYTLVTDGEMEGKMTGDMSHHHHSLDLVKKDKLERLEKQKRTVMILFPLSLLVFVLMIISLLTPLMLSNTILFAIASIVFFVFGKDFIIALGRFLRTGAANMDTLIGIGALAAYLYSDFVILFPEIVKRRGLSETTYFDVIIVVIGFILFGKYLEARSKIKTGEAIEKLVLLQSKTALVEKDGREIEVAADMVMKGDIVIVKPGTKVPVDGLIISGKSSLDQSVITGESMPVDKNVGDEVIGGTLNKQGYLKIKATKVGKDTLLAHIIKMVEDAMGSKAPVERIADRISAYFVPAVLVIAFLSLLAWIFIGSQYLPVSQSLAYGLSCFVGVLVIACPCALGLATPTAIIVGVGKGAQNGILIKDAESLEKLRSVTTIVMDKTGTLTKGEPEVVNFINFSKETDKDLIFAAASLEKHSEHPLAKAVLKYAVSQDVTPADAANFKALEGLGVTGSVGKKVYYLGNTKLAQDKKIVIDDRSIYKLTHEGKTPVFLMQGKKLLAALFIADVLKDNAVTAVKDLHRLGIKVVMLTGDNTATARFIGDQAGVDEVIAEVLPTQKAEKIKALKEGGKVIAMIGDGVNDAPALAIADVGIAMGTGTDIAIESANITLLQGDLNKLVKAVRLSQKTMATIKQNLFWAFIYNCLGIPVAAGALYPFFGILLNPVFAGAAMALSSVSVVTNSLRLKQAKL